MIIAETTEISEKLCSAVGTDKYEFVTELSRRAAENRLKNEKFGAVIICPPVGKTDGAELSVSLAESTAAAVLLLCKREKLAALEAKTKDYGVFTVALPLSKNEFSEALRFAFLSAARLSLQNKEKKVLQVHIEELKLLDRAKCALIQYLKMTEKEAHAFIEKQAMDKRVTKREVIENILKTYES